MFAPFNLWHSAPFHLHHILYVIRITLTALIRMSDSRRYSVSEVDVDGLLARAVLLRDASADVECVIAPERGAEITSLKYKGLQLVHRALDYTNPPVDGWYGHGQVLFPAVGRHKDSTYAWQGVQRPIALHGFAKTVAFKVEDTKAEDDSASVTCAMESSDTSSFDGYPFAFRLAITFTLSGGVLRVQHRIKAGSTATPFAIGNHITLKFPFTPTGTWNAGVLASTVTHEHELAPGSLLSGVVTPRPEFQSMAGMSIRARNVCDGVFGFDTVTTPSEQLAGLPCSLMIIQPGSVSVEVSHSVRLVDDAGLPPMCDWADVSAHRHFVLWGQPPPSQAAAQEQSSTDDASSKTSTPTSSSTTSDGQAAHAQGFICPEPWVSGPDSLNTRAGLPILAPGQTAEWMFCLAPSGPLR